MSVLRWLGGPVLQSQGIDITKMAECSKNDLVLNYIEKGFFGRTLSRIFKATLISAKYTRHVR